MNVPPDGARDGVDDEASGAGRERPPSKRPDAPPTSRLGRLARLSALAPRAFPMAAEAVRRAVNGKSTRDVETEKAAQARVLASARKTAEAMLKTLGDMKGLPLKLGQMASYIDGLAPPGYEEKFQAVLKKLQQKAPPLSREAAARVVREELGAPAEQVFASWEADPFAAASIGQVHRATTARGEKLAVKVQYPGIDRAIENDLKSVSLLESMVAPLGRRYHTKETLDEIKAVFLAELDYGREAAMTDTFRRVHEEDDDIVVPRVHHALSTRRVLSTAFVEGLDYQAFASTASQADRDAAGSTIWRFMFRSLFRHGLLYADPHPGNYRFLGGGRVAFLDYGCVKELPASLVNGMKRYITAAQREDWPAFERACVEVLGYDPDDRAGWELLTGYTKMLLEPFTRDAPYRNTHATARETIAYLVRNGREVVFKEGEALPNLPKPIDMPAEFTFVNRLQWGLASVMAGLEAESNYRRLTAPWLEGPLVPVPASGRSR